MRRCFWSVLAIIGVLSAGSLRAAESARSKQRPNVLFCIADDWSWPHAGIYGDPVVKTPNFDRIAREGALFLNAFCAAPSCTPSRAAILTGKYPHQLEEGANLWGFLPKKYRVYPDLLEAAGYHVGVMRKGWGPGNFQAGGRARNPAGPAFKSFQEFLNSVPPDKPFCFWFGSQDPHRPYEKGSGAAAGMDPSKVFVPPHLPDTLEVRHDILDYYVEVMRFDRELGELLGALESRGQLDNTLIVVTSDNGMPFPRCKTNLHDSGSHMPLAIRWPARLAGGKVIREFVSLTDLAPTFLEAAGLEPSPEMNGQSLLPLLASERQEGRGRVFIERERHANVRKGDLSYPARAIRTAQFLYIQNLRTDRWPAGDPEMWKAVGEFGDCDNGPSKELILSDREKFADAFRLAFEKRPAEELYDLSKDPHQLKNVATESEYVSVRKKLQNDLERWQGRTQDPRITGAGDEFDRYPYFGDMRRAPAR